MPMRPDRQGVVLCRSPAQNAELAEALRGSGRQILQLPTFEIEYLPSPLPEPAAGDWLLFVSAHALQGLLHRGPLPGGWDLVQLAAVGARTGARVAEAFNRGDVLCPGDGEAGDAKALMQLLEPRLHQAGGSARVWLMRGEPGGRWLPARLQSLGVLRDCVVYRQHELPWPAAALAPLTAPSSPAAGWVWVLTSVRIAELVAMRLAAAGMAIGATDRALVVHPRIADVASRWWPRVELCTSLDGLARTIESGP